MDEEEDRYGKAAGRPVIQKLYSTEVFILSYGSSIKKWGSGVDWFFQKGDLHVIITYERVSFDLILKWARYLAWGFCFFFIGWMGLLFFLSMQKSFQGNNEIFHRKNKGVVSPFVYESIGTGALALSSKQQLGWVADVARELIIVAHNSRPDMQEENSAILLRVKGNPEFLTAHNGKAIFLDDTGPKMQFGKEGCSLWVQPILLGQEGILVEVGRKTEALGEEKSQFVVPMPQGKAKPEDAGLKFLNSFNGALFWGRDKLLELYGGEQFEERKGKYRLSFTAPSGIYACYLSEGDELVWKEGEWVEKGAENSSQYPLAKVMSLSPQGIKLKVWDVSGFEQREFELPLQLPKPLEKSVGLSPSALRLRTTSQVSCMLGKKRMVVKKGDWLLKVGGVVRNMRTSQDIQMCLTHRLKGELLIIDGIEREGNAWVMKGTLFDTMRTQAIPVTFPVDIEKKKNTKKPRLGRKAQ